MTRKELCRSSLLASAAACALLCSSLAALAEGVAFEVELLGPAVGDQDGEATGTVTLDAATNQVDVQLRYTNIAEPTAIFVRQGALGTEGNVVMPIVVESAAEGAVEAHRTSAKRGLVETILAAPDEYFLVIMNDEYPIGALRGPLSQ